jgi:HlyD family secretion protein
MSAPGLALAGLAMLALPAGCSRPEHDRLQGYVEGEFVYVASPLSGELQNLHVGRGAQVQRGDPLFALESEREQAALEETKARLAQARANLENARKGRRPSEIAAIEAQLGQAQAALALAERELARLERLARSRAASQEELDRARSLQEQNRQRVAQLEAELRTAQLGARPDEIAAAEANVRAFEAELAAAEWELTQKQQTAEEAGLVFDTLYREGEWVAAGRPVVVLLPPENIKVRAFVPETRVAAVQLGEPVRVTADGLPEPFTGKVSFISPRAEYTPPVIYSRESRSKLVFMIEIVFDPAAAAKLHPGQPVDVEW